MTRGIPEPPEHLTDAAQRVWRAFAAEHGVTIGDIPFYELFCDSYARHRELIHKANELGPLVTIKGEVRTNPYLTRADKEAANFKSALIQMLRARHGRRHADDNEEDASEAKAIEELRAQIIAHVTGGSEVTRAIADDRQSDRDRTEGETPSARRVRKKKEA